MNKPSRIILLWIAILLVLAISCPRVTSVTAAIQKDIPQVTLEVIPSQIELQFQRKETVFITVRNQSGQTLSAASLDALPGEGIQVVDLDQRPRQIEPDEAVVWTVHITSIPGSRINGGVIFHLSYLWLAASGAKETHGESFTTLKVIDNQSAAIGKWIDAKVQLSSGQITDYRPAEGYLILTNISGGRLRIDQIDFEKPSFLQITKDYTLPLEIEPQETHAFPFSVAAQEAIRPGKHLLMLNVKVSPTISDGTSSIPSINMFFTQEIDAGILGESQLLTLLGIPSFLFLPGFLIVLVFSLLWHYISPQKEFPIKAPSPEFFFAAITLSLLMMLVYTPLFGQNYLESYNLENIVEVWFRSLLMALLLYMLSLCAYNGISTYKAYHQRKETEKKLPNSKDTPVALMRKLGEQKLGVKLERRCILYKNKDQNIFLFEPLSDEKKTVWVGPEIGIHWQNFEPKFKEQINKEMEANGDIKFLADLLATGIKSGQLIVVWNKNGEIDLPVRIKKEDIKSYIPPGIVVVELAG